MGIALHVIQITTKETGHSDTIGVAFTYASHFFRMPMFFFLAGFLAGHSQRKGSNWLPQRVMQLGVPLLFVWTFCLLPLALINGPVNIPRPGLTDSVHLWFLINLILITVPVYYFDRHLGFSMLSWKQPPVRMWLFAWLFASFLIGLLDIFILHFHLPYTIENIALTPVFAFFYVSGFAVERTKEFTDAFRGTRLAYAGPIMWASLVFLRIWFASEFASPHRYLTVKALFYASTGVGAALFCITMLYSAFKVHRRPAAVVRLSRASYTMYLLHWPLIVATSLALGGQFSNFAATALVMFLIVCSLTYNIHEALVQRVPVARFLLNGVRPDRVSSIPSNVDGNEIPASGRGGV